MSGQCCAVCGAYVLSSFQTAKRFCGRRCYEKWYYWNKKKEAAAAAGY